MLALTKGITQDAEIRRLIAGIDGGACPAVISGLSPVHRAHVLAALRAATGRPVVAVCADEPEAGRFARDLETLTQEDVSALYARDFTFYNAEGVSRELEQRRLHTLYQMARGQAPILVASAGGLMQRAIPRDALLSSAITLRMNQTYDLTEIIRRLVTAGYSRAEQVEGRGQFAVRGGILDFFSPAYEMPVRCEFFGDEIDSMGFFDTSTQRRTSPADSAVILPSAETLPQLCDGGAAELISLLETARTRLKKNARAEALAHNISADIDRLADGRAFPAADKYMELIYPMATAAELLPEDAIVFISEPARVKERAERYAMQIAEECAALLDAGVLDSSLTRFSESWEGLVSRLETFAVVMADSFTASSYPWRPRALYSCLTKQLPSYGGSLETAAGDIAHYEKSDYRTVVTCADRRRADALCEYLAERGAKAAVDYALARLPEPGTCAVTVGALSAGMEYPGIKLAVITEGQLLQTAAPRRKKTKTKTNRERVQSFTDLSPGDLVVHEQHGIGRYVGVSKMPVDGVVKDYVKIAYAGTDSLYIPATQLDLISKYIGGGEDTSVRLSKMGGAEWVKAKSRAKASAKDMAKELIALYAARGRVRGHAFAPDSVWQSEFEDKFGYQETDDQIRSVEEIKLDMEKPVPMDRLLCGDVGYGKTEVALRAVMKCVTDGYQAAILVPTTVLAQQHYVTASQRFAGYPVNIEVLSRFKSPAQIKSALKGAQRGGVDVIIGTHRLLQKDVTFRKLGLLIVDEEQRFGVTHKERLKELSKNVDVLTLSATPIPRTLNMALSGIRDMSAIEEPPMDRQPVQTYVMEHDWGVLTDAMRREVARGGQVYYIHNRIENIARAAARISEMLEDVTVAVAHGRMDEEALSDVMERMSSGEISVLVCTTIIETGIDIPNVNTLIIEDADKLGLAQLHQIRGRVGRSPRRAFAYLTFRQGKALTEIAEKRLSAIREFAEFNSGFKIAMRDLEIRGAGNLLGAEQSGHMMKVGYDMYLKLLEEAVLEERGEKPKKKAECAADLSVSAFLPDDYVPSGEQRMDLYRRIARVQTEEDADEMLAELIDRYGDPPPAAVSLVEIARLRYDAAEAGVAEITQKDGWLRFRIEDFDMKRVSALYAIPKYTGRVRVEAGSVPVIALKLKTANVADEAVKFVSAYAGSRAVF